MKLRLRAHKKLRAHKAGGASVRSIVAAEVGNLLCHTCATQVELSHKFCVQCGCELDCEEMFIRHYFFKGYAIIKQIMHFLPNTTVYLSLRTLKSRISSYGLKKKNANIDTSNHRCSHE